MIKQTKSPFRSIILELTAALGVLALVFLSFAHQPIDPYSGQVFRLADGSIPVFCGSAPGTGENNTEYKCEACRLSFGLNLLDVACADSEIFQQVEQVLTTGYDIAHPLGLIDRTARPRAPPFARIFS